MKGISFALVVLSPSLASADEVVDTCVACHKDALSLKGKQAPAIAARLKDMRDGRARHPVPLPNLTDSEIESLSRALTAQ